MLQMVAAGRGVAALPRWLVEEYGAKVPVRPVRLGPAGIAKQIFLGLRERDRDVDYLGSFMTMARDISWDQTHGVNCPEKTSQEPGHE